METINIFETKEKNHKQGIKESFPVTGMTCASCASSVESVLKHTDGVFDASVNFASSSVLVDYDKELSPNQFQNALREVGYDIIIDAENPSEVQQELQQKHYKDIKPYYLVGYTYAPHFCVGNVLYAMGTREVDFFGIGLSHSFFGSGVAFSSMRSSRPNTVKLIWIPWSL